VRGKLVLLIGVFLMVLIASCATPEKAPQASGQWINNMHRLSQAYLNLMPYAADAKEYFDPKNRSVIAGNLKELREVSAQISKDPQPPDADPVIGYTSTRFSIEMKQAQTAYEMNDLPLSRFSLSHASDYCINCHTSINRGSRDFPVAWQLPLAKLPPALKIESLMANRQYASAVTLTQSFVWNKVAVQTHPRLWQLTMERVMALVIRVNDDSATALQLATAAMNNEAAPFYVRNDAAAWFDDIKAWRKEKVPQGDRAKLALAKKLVAQASVRPHMTANLVPSLRASALLHDLLQRAKGASRAEVLYQAGLVGQSLRDINLGYLDQYDFEQCIRTLPHSDLAETCFVELETSVRDSNLFVDLDPGNAYASDTWLAGLRQLAEVKDPEGPPGWKTRIWDYNLDENGQPTKKGRKEF